MKRLQWQNIHIWEIWVKDLWEFFVLFLQIFGRSEIPWRRPVACLLLRISDSGCSSFHLLSTYEGPDNPLWPHSYPTRSCHYAHLAEKVPGIRQRKWLSPLTQPVAYMWQSMNLSLSDSSLRNHHHLPCKKRHKFPCTMSGSAQRKHSFCILCKTTRGGGEGGQGSLSADLNLVQSSLIQQFK